MTTHTHTPHTAGGTVDAGETHFQAASVLVPSHPRTLAPSHPRTLAPSHPRTLARPALVCTRRVSARPATGCAFALHCICTALHCARCICTAAAATRYRRRGGQRRGFTRVWVCGGVRQAVLFPPFFISGRSRVQPKEAPAWSPKREKDFVALQQDHVEDVLVIHG